MFPTLTVNGSTPGNETQYEEEDHMKNIPVMVVLSLYVIVGIVGNSLIIYVYGFRFKKSTTRVFILSLAIADEITCILLPYKIILLRYGDLYTNPHLARLEMVRLYFLQVSVMILPLVSVDRYRRICKSFSSQIEPWLAKILVGVVCVVMASLCILRMCLSNGQTGKPYRAEALVSADYLDSSYHGSSISSFYFIWGMIPFCLPLPIMVVMYSLIGLKLRHHFKEQQPSFVEASRADDMSTEDIFSNTDVKSTSNAEAEAFRGDAAIKEDPHSSVFISDDNEMHTISKVRQDSKSKRIYLSQAKSEIEKNRDLAYASVTSQLTSGENTTKRALQPSLKHVNLWKRMTLIFFLITITYVISLLPFISVFGIFRTKPEHGKELLNHPVFIVLYNSIYIANVSNCFLYGFFDPRFRRELKKVKRRVKRSLRGKKLSEKKVLPNEI